MRVGVFCAWAVFVSDCNEFAKSICKMLSWTGFKKVFISRNYYFLIIDNKILNFQLNITLIYRKLYIK